jgi:CRISPR/Cas system CMR subunit Cmr4 (Cas7 group RAMP superfamily)
MNLTLEHVNLPLVYTSSLEGMQRIMEKNTQDSYCCIRDGEMDKGKEVQGDSFGTRPKKMLISQRLYIIQFNIL